MKSLTVRWFCRPLGARSLAGGISQNVGRREPGRRHTFASAKTNRAPSVGERGLSLRAAQNGQFWGVHIVHTSGGGLARTGGGPGRIGDVSGSSQFLQGLEPGSSPTSGTKNPSSEGFLL